jgi:tetratricopeptide (TPR) repeat protein
MVLTGTGHLSHGVERLEDVRKTFFEKNRRCLYAASENTLGRVYFEIAHGTAPKDPWMIARNLGFLAKTVPFASKKAEGYFTRAAEAAKAIGAKSILAQSCLNLGLLYKAKDKKDKARRFLDEAIGLFEQCEADVYLKQAREVLASLG